MDKYQKTTIMGILHITDVVAVHLKAFPGFTLSCLGPRFLKEFYTGVIDDPSGIAYVITDHKYMIGFVAGSAQPNGFYRRLLRKRWWRFGIAALPAVISTPRIFPMVIRAFSMPKEKLPHPNCSTLLSIAVDPVYQGGGVGSMLVKAFLAESKALGLDVVNLTTDAINNEKTNQFYKKLGFTMYRNFTTPEGRSMNEYIYNLENFNCK